MCFNLIDGESYTTPKESAQGCETVTGHNIIGKIPGSSGEKKVVVTKLKL